MNTKQEIKIVSQIIQELALFLMFRGYNHYELAFDKSDTEEVFMIRLQAIDDSLIEFMKEKITKKREEEIEAYYWELLGDMDSTSELEIIGLLIDTFETKVHQNYTEIILTRKL